MANTRQILQRRNAVDSISRVTRTLEMVSTARYKMYANKRSSIVDYHDALTMLATLLSTAQTPIDHALLKENKSGCTAILALGSRKGLCGSYNNQVLRLVKVHQRHAQIQKKELYVYVPAGHSTVVSLPVADQDASLTLRLSGDDHAFDNTLHLAQPWDQRRTLLYLGPEDPNDPKGLLFYLKKALASDTTRSLTIRSKGARDPLTEADVLQAQAVVVGDVLSPDRQAWLSRALALGRLVSCWPRT